MRLSQFESTQAAVAHVVNILWNNIKQTAQSEKLFTVAVAGGSTLLPVFKQLSNQQLDPALWKHVHFFWVDERWVPHDHAESNYGCAMQVGLNHIPAQFHPFDTSLPNPQACCDVYTNILKATLGKTCSLDYAILGVGDDGHIASVFAADIDAARQGLTIATHHPVTHQPRVGVTLQTISQAKHVIVLVLGSHKRGILEAMHTGINKNFPIVALTELKPDIEVVTDIHD